MIKTDDVSSEANIFAAFADKRTGILFNDLTGAFPYMSLEGNICFLVVYHYKTNAILALPIKGFSNKIIFATNQQQYNMFEAKGYNIKLNVMDNQATNVIKKSLTKNNATYCWLSHITIESMPPNTQFKFSRRTLLVPLLQLIAISHYNCGIN
jgi:hypothetical protein